jgi:hypothetical protein
VEVAGDTAEHLSPQRGGLFECGGQCRGGVAQQPDIGDRYRVDRRTGFTESRLGAEDPALTKPCQRTPTAFAFD